MRLPVGWAADARRGLAVLLALACIASAAPHVAASRGIDRVTTSTGKRFAALVHDVDGIRNFAEIRPGIARGGQPTEEGIRVLRERGYHTVISFRSNPAERELLHRSGIDYVEIPMRAGIFSASPPSEEQIRLFLAVVSDSSRGPVFIHCHRGKDRTGVMAAIYRMEACGWTADEAIEEMQAFGFSDQYRALLRFVREYQPRVGVPASSESARN